MPNKMRLSIFCEGNVIRLDGEEDYLRKVMAVYATAKNGGNHHGVITGSNFVLNIGAVQGLVIGPVPVQEHPTSEQEQYFKEVRKKLSEADWWKNGGGQ